MAIPAPASYGEITNSTRSTSCPLRRMVNIAAAEGFVQTKTPRQNGIRRQFGVPLLRQGRNAMRRDVQAESRRGLSTWPRLCELAQFVDNYNTRRYD